MSVYVLRYKNWFAKNRKNSEKSTRFPAKTDQEALNYAIDWCDKRRFDMIILWREEKKVKTFEDEIPGLWPAEQPYTELVTVYCPGDIDKDW